jgi:AraC family transcriptional regulator of adaptative response/methylated-DNA-[protein]-cysteine methyltransferase
VTLSEADCWQAVISRDGRYDGMFVYAVSSTGIYCRPSCSARQPRRENVAFFALPTHAEAAGYRACRRCHPQDFAAPDPQVELVRKACRFIELHVDESPNLADIGAHVGMSPFHFQRVFKRVMGITPRQYTDAHRLDCLKQRLRLGESVTDALYDAGYGSSSRLYERAGTHLGMTPATYRRGGEGMDINYVIVEAPLSEMDYLLVAQTERGICAVHLGSSQEALEQRIHAEYPLANIERNQYSLCNWVESILSYLEGQQPHLDLPLDLQATAFQWRVWQEVCKIPYGEWRTYAEITHALGLPDDAIGDVARTIAENPVAALIPSHRTGNEQNAPSEHYDPRDAQTRQALIDLEQHQDAPPDPTDQQR